MASDATLIRGDCLQVMAELPDASVDMVLCDLPYGTTRCAWDSLIPLAPLWAAYRRVCKPAAAVVLFAQTPFDKVLGASNLEDLRYEWIWEKTQPTGHLNAGRAPMKAHENALVFYREQPVYNPLMTRGHARKTAVKRGDVTRLYGAQTDADLAYDSTERFPRSVITFPKETQSLNLHPTQKPTALCEYLIRTYTDDRAVVLDNCMGSGTTGVAARRWNRRFIGIEKDPEIFATAERRLAERELI